MTMMKHEELIIRWAHAKFDKSRFKKRYGLDFEIVRSHFESDGSFATIANELQQSEDLVRAMYWECFYQICPSREDAQRRRVKRHRNERYEKLELGLPERSPAALVARAARAAGCAVQVLPRLEARHLHGGATKRIGVNGRLCLLQLAHKIRGAVNVTRETCVSVTVFVMLLPTDDGRHHMYVIPATAIYEHFFKNYPRRRTACLYLHFNGRCGRGFCTRAYKDAWWVVGQLR